MNAMASQITGVSIVYSAVYSGADQRKWSASLASVREIHRWPVNSPHKGSVTRKMFPFDDIIMFKIQLGYILALDIFYMHVVSAVPNFGSVFLIIWPTNSKYKSLFSLIRVLQYNFECIPPVKIPTKLESTTVQVVPYIIVIIDSSWHARFTMELWLCIL